MDQHNRERLNQVWEQGRIPVLFLQGTGHKLWTRLPYSDDNRRWLQQFGRHNPTWHKEGRYWIVPKAWFQKLVDGSLERHGAVYTLQKFRHQEKCAPQCVEAKGDECECSCLGANHGAGNLDRSWKVVSDTFATRWGEIDIACKLLEKR